MREGGRICGTLRVLCLRGRFAGGGTELLDDVFEDLLVVLITETKGGR